MRKNETEISVGAYTLHADGQCYWITKKSKTKSKDDKERFKDENVSGYLRTFEQVLDSFFEHQLRDSEAKTFKQELKAIDRARIDAKKIIREYHKNLNTK